MIDKVVHSCPSLVSVIKTGIANDKTSNLDYVNVMCLDVMKQVRHGIKRLDKRI